MPEIPETAQVTSPPPNQSTVQELTLPLPWSLKLFPESPGEPGSFERGLRLGVSSLALLGVGQVNGSLVQYHFGIFMALKQMATAGEA